MKLEEFLEREGIHQDVLDCGMPIETVSKFAESERRHKTGNYLFSTMLFGGGIITQIFTALTMANIIPSPSGSLASSLGYPLPIGAPQAIDIGLSIATATACIPFIFNYASRYDLTFLRKTAENERARNRGESLPYDEHTYNPEELARRL